MFRPHTHTVARREVGGAYSQRASSPLSAARDTTSKLRPYTGLARPDVWKLGGATAAEHSMVACTLQCARERVCVIDRKRAATTREIEPVVNISHLGGMGALLPSHWLSRSWSFLWKLLWFNLVEHLPEQGWLGFTNPALGLLYPSESQTTVLESTFLFFADLFSTIEGRQGFTFILCQWMTNDCWGLHLWIAPSWLRPERTWHRSTVSQNLYRSCCLTGICFCLSRSECMGDC